MECCNTPDGNSVFSVASRKLEVLASQKGFSIHSVPYDENCMFSAVSYQLQITSVCDVDGNKDKW